MLHQMAENQIYGSVIASALGYFVLMFLSLQPSLCSACTSDPFIETLGKVKAIIIMIIIILEQLLQQAAKN